MQLSYLIRDLAILTEPYMPATSRRILAFLGLADASWSDLHTYGNISELHDPEILFEKLEDDRIEELRTGIRGHRSSDNRKKKRDRWNRDSIRVWI